MLCITLHKDSLWYVGRLGIILRRKHLHLETLVYIRGNKGSFCNKADTGLLLKQKKRKAEHKATVFLQCIKIKAGAPYTRENGNFRTCNSEQRLARQKVNTSNPRIGFSLMPGFWSQSSFIAACAARQRLGQKSFLQRFPFSRRDYEWVQCQCTYRHQLGLSQTYTLASRKPLLMQIQALLPLETAYAYVVTER